MQKRSMQIEYRILRYWIPGVCQWISQNVNKKITRMTKRKKATVSKKDTVAGKDRYCKILYLSVTPQD